MPELFSLLAANNEKSNYLSLFFSLIYFYNRRLKPFDIIVKSKKILNKMFFSNKYYTSAELSINALNKCTVFRISSRFNNDVGEWIYLQGTETTELGTPLREI